MTKQYNRIALLPMKGNSERVPGKNFRDFAGKPLFRWILDTLLGMQEIDAVVINTDARHVLAEHGLEASERVIIRDRTPEICGDLVSMNLIIADDLKAIKANTYLMTHTTNPLLSADSIRKAIEVFESESKTGGKDSLFTANRWQTRFYREDGSAVNHDPDNLLRTQDLEVWYEENSNLYLFNAQSFAETNARIGRAPVILETPRMESFDIDDQEGWDLAELVAKHFWQASYDRLAERYQQ